MIALKDLTIGTELVVSNYGILRVVEIGENYIIATNTIRTFVKTFTPENSSLFYIEDGEIYLDCGVVTDV